MNLGPIINNALYKSGIKPTGTKYSSKTGRMSADDVLNEKTIDKMKELATNDAVKGVRGHAATIFKHQIREKAAPDRRRLFAKAEANASREVRKAKHERSHELWEYLLDITDKLDEGSVKGQYGSDEYVFMEVFDENGDICGRYDSNSGWHIKYTPDEETVMNVLGTVYNETFLAVYREYHGKNNDAPDHTEAVSQLDVKA